MPRSHRFQALLVCTLAVLLVLGTIPGVAAADTSVGPTVVVERDETLTDDLTAAAGTVVILGTVDGDVTALAGDVIISGDVTGDVTAFAGRVEVTGQVGGTVVSFGGVTSVDGTLDDDIDVIGGALSVTGEVSGSVDAIAAVVTIEDDALVEGQLQTTAVRTRINGTVLGGANVPETPSNQTVGEAQNESLVSTTNSQPFAQESELVSHFHALTGVSLPIASANAFFPAQSTSSLFSISFLDAYGFLVNVLLGVLLVGLLPELSMRVASLVVYNPVRTGLFGIAATIAIPVVLVLLGLSLFGLPLALAGGALFFITWWIGAVYGRFSIGVWILESLPRALAILNVETNSIENRWLSLLVGLVVVALLTAIPYIGPIVEAAVTIFGAGALVRLVYEAYTRTERHEEPTSP